MRIGIDASRALTEPRTGTERYAWEIVRGLLARPEATQDRWHLFVQRAPSAAEAVSLTGHGVGAASHVHWHVLPWRRMWTHRALGPAVRRAGLDVLFVPSHVIPVTVPWRANPPSVVTVHDLGYRHWPATHPRLQRLYLDLSTRWNLRTAAQVIAVSRATAADIAADIATQTSGVASRLTVVYEARAAAPDWTPPSGAAIAAARAHFGLPADYAIFTGTLHPRKNVARLIAAYAHLRRTEDIDWPLVLAGAGGWQAAAFRQQAEHLDVAGWVRFLGYVAEPLLPGLMAGARLLAFPSLFEGFGLPVLEAQGLGVPVMTSNYSSLPEVAGDAALYVDPTDVEAIADAMLRLSQDEALRARLIAAGYENVKRFSWEKAADETYAVLRRAAGQ